MNYDREKPFARLHAEDASIEADPRKKLLDKIIGFEKYFDAYFDIRSDLKHKRVRDEEIKKLVDTRMSIESLIDNNFLSGLEMVRNLEMGDQEKGQLLSLMTKYLQYRSLQQTAERHPLLELVEHMSCIISDRADCFSAINWERLEELSEKGLLEGNLSDEELYEKNILKQKKAGHTKCSSREKGRGWLRATLLIPA